MDLLLAGIYLVNNLESIRKKVKQGSGHCDELIDRYLTFVQYDVGYAGALTGVIDLARLTLTFCASNRSKGSSKEDWFQHWLDVSDIEIAAIQRA